MSAARKSGGHDSAERAMRALERGAAAVGVGVARSLRGGWRRMPASRRASLERLVETVTGRPDERVAAAPPDPEVGEIRIRDLRADLARELERLADAEIRAARAPGRTGDGAGPADGQAPPGPSS